MFGTLLFWVLCWAMNMTHHHVFGFDVKGVTPSSSHLIETGYWVIPKPLDMSGIFFDAMRAENYSTPVPQLTRHQVEGPVPPGMVGRGVARVRAGTPQHRGLRVPQNRLLKRQ